MRATWLALLLAVTGCAGSSTPTATAPRSALPSASALAAPAGSVRVKLGDRPCGVLGAAGSVWVSLYGEAALVRTKILPLESYYDLLAPLAAETDVWRTAYQHRMASPEAIVDWVRGTGLRPFIDPLSEHQRAGFLADYTSRIAEAYRPKADGRLLLAFPRLFVVARSPR